MKWYYFAVIAPLVAIGTHAAQAAGVTVPGNQYTITLDTGLRDFVATFPSQTVDTNGNITGTTVSDNAGRQTVPDFNASLGILQSIGGLVAFVGYPFDATYTVQGATDSIGDKVVAHEDVSGTIEMDVNGKPVASTPFSVALNPSCTAASNGFTVIVCPDTEKQAYFTDGVPVAINQGDVVSFDYQLTEQNISCEVLPVGGGSPFTCIQGDTSITDLHNINDPQWDGSLAVTYTYTPEPASIALLGFGLAGLVTARRRGRRT